MTGNGLSGFVYAIGTIEADYPNPAIEREMQVHAEDMKIRPALGPRSCQGNRPRTDIGNMQVLSEGQKANPLYRAAAPLAPDDRGFPWSSCSTPADPNDLDRLIDALERPQYGKPEPAGPQACERQRKETRSKSNRRSVRWRTWTS